MRGANGVRQGPMPAGGNLVIPTTDQIPNPPSHLGVSGQIRWRQITVILRDRGVWSNDWIPALEHLCVEYDNLAVIDLALRQNDQFMLVPSTNGRTLKTNPLLDYRLKIRAFIQSMLAHFGLTPMSSKGIFTATESQLKPKIAVRTINDDNLFN